VNPMWVKYGDRRGWQWPGVVPAKQIAGMTFWAKAARVACAAEGGQLDMVQCYDRGIMSVGPFGATAAFGALGDFLSEIPRNILVQYLGELFRRTCLSLNGTVLMRGLSPATLEELNYAFRGGADDTTWEESFASASLALEWVRAFAAMLADTASHRGVGMACSKLLSTIYMTPAAGELLGMRPSSTPPASAAAQRAAACFLSFAVNHPQGAMRLLRTAGCDADRMLDAAMAAGPWPATFGQRVARTRAALASEAWG